MNRFLLISIVLLSLSSAFSRTGHAQEADAPPERISFPTQDGGLIAANLYGKGDRGVVLAHGGRFNKESWEPQAQRLVKAGFRVLAFDFRGFGQSRGPGEAVHLDVLAAVRYLRRAGAQTVAVVGGSFGGGAGADATIEAEPGEIERLIVLGAVAGDRPPEKMRGHKLFILTREDANAAGLRLPGALRQYEAVPQPKRLLLLEGAAHAQFLFASEHRERVMDEILRFLTAELPPQRLLLVQEALRSRSLARYARLETNIARNCVRLRCPHPYLALASVTGPKVVWWLNAFASAEEQVRVEQAWQRNAAALKALRTLSEQKKTLTQAPVTWLTEYRADLSDMAAWKMNGARFFVVSVTTEAAPSAQSVFAAPDGKLFVFTPATTLREAQRLAQVAGPNAQVLAVQPQWSLPAPAWVAADPAFWRMRSR